MKKFIILTVSLLLLMLSIATVSAEDNGTDVLSDSSDVQTFEDIQTSIDNADENDVIELNGTYIGDKSIKVSKSLTIQSKEEPAVLDGQNNTRIFHVNGGNLTFKNIIFTNAVSNKGGAFYSLGNLEFINCTFKNNYGENGGAIYSKASVTATDCIFDTNFAKTSGGAICCEYSLNKNQSKTRAGNVDVESSTFINNNAVSGGGISIYLTGNAKGDSSYGNVNVKNSVFTNNTGVEFGGAINYGGSSNYGNFIVEKSNFTRNFANEGSAIHASDDDFKLTGCNFIENSGYYSAVYFSFDCNGIIKKCNFINNTAEAVSALMLYSAEVSLTDCKFEQNSVATISSYYNSKLTITNGKTTKTYKKDVVLDNSFKSATTLTVMASDLTADYGSGDKFTVQIIDKNTKKPIKFYSVIINFKNGKKERSIYRSTDENGKIKIRITTGLAAGTYSVTYISDDWGKIDASKNTLTIKKGKANVNAPEVTNKYKKSKKFKITLTDKKNEGLYKVKVKVKVFTGKKAKTYNLITDYDGVCKINTKTLSKGSHKVVVNSADKNYKFSAKSKIIIK
ncbi:hypothetical protein [Methanobrevibacter sp.]|uniref:hypothetical protein n=1 Tax=Methanobrevibacter sp. TaxID=66852 RepID=UPI00388F350A